MKNLIQKTFLVIVLSLGMGLATLAATTDVFADDCPETSILKVSCDENGGGIWAVLNIIVIILSSGVAIAAVVGMGIAAFTYATAGGSEERVKKSKDRILQIVIGMLIYGVLFLALEWLIPGGLFR
ncbi:MAG: hypothetical protein LBL84_00780 [Candidatus Nomurabacteria bacterium]|jgi:hypothetical protein|nr:hypothetical protein [Candidatus Nomurabacteria bacterium]